MTTQDESTIPFVKQGKYAILDTTLKSQNSMWFDEMSGDVGDAGRTVYLAIKERALNNDPKTPLKPMDMTGMDVRFQGHDAQGKYKRIALSTKIDNAKLGLVQITLPRFIYQAVGPYEDGEFEIYETQGNTVISTIPVAFEVYNNHANMTTGDSQVYSDEFEKLMHDFEISSSSQINDFNKRMNDLVQQISTANNSVDALKQLVDTWTKLVESKSVAILAADNTFTGNMHVQGTAVLDKFAQGYTTGNWVEYFSSAEPQQDLNSVEKIQKMPAMTRSSTYYTDNKVKNNPLDSEYVLVETIKMTALTAYQTITTQSDGYGEVKKRTVKNITTGLEFTDWVTVEKWSPWKSLMPYFTSDFKQYFANGDGLPQFRFNGQSVQLRGAFAPTRIIKPANSVQKIQIAKNLPFESKTSQCVAQPWSQDIPYTLRVERNEMWMERIYNTDGSVATLQPTHLLTLGGSFALV